jgi:large subunit ribosomal protein L7Ae
MKDLSDPEGDLQHMAQPIYVKFEVPTELENSAMEALELARDTGKIRKGTNEATKAAERSTGKLIFISEDINPAEIVAHLPLLCEEKNIPYIYIKKQEELGAACGLKVGCGSAVILEAGKAKDQIDDVINKIQALK